jgi:N-acetyltransferase
MPTTASWIDPSLVLAGRHVRLVPLEMAHAPALFQAGAHEEIWRYVPFRVRNLADMEEYVRLALGDRERGDAHPFAILSAGSGQVLGSTRYYALARSHRNLEVGYTWLDPSVWRTGVNTECKLLLLGHAFEALDCLRAALRTDSRNLRSQRAMERFGAVREGVFRKHLVLPDGFIRDTVYYSVTDEEWPGVKGFLRNALDRVS